ATPAASSGNERRVESRRNALVAVCTRSRFGFHAVTDHPGFLAYHHLRQLRPVCPCQCDRAHQLAGIRALRLRRHPVDPGVVLALLGTDSGFQRAAARCSYAVGQRGRRTSILGKPLGGLPFAAVARGGSTFRVAFLELAGGAEIGSETTLRAAPF